MRILQFLSKIGVVAAVIVLCVALVSCAQPAPQPVTQVAPSLVIVPTVVDTKAKQVAVYGSAFTPNTPVDIAIGGTWQLGSGESTAEMIEPNVLYVKTNAQGVFKGQFRMDRFRIGYDLSPGIYVLKAVVSHKVVATAPLEVTKAQE